MNRATTRRVRVRESMSWSDVAELMEKIAVRAEEDAQLHHKLAAMHRSLARDLRALLRGKLVLA